MTNLFVLAINSNLFTGPIDSLVNPSVQQHLLKVDISSNALTGTIPAALFQLPTIQSVICASNCLTGSIPLTVCTATNLTSLVLDGLHTSLACNDKIFPWVSSSVYSLSTGSHLEYVPSCLFVLPQLTLLHLSGNAISGPLDSNISVSRSLSSLDLSHNAITGTIPTALTSHYFDSLDLSFNQFTGVLPDDMVVASVAQNQSNSATTYTTLRLQVNRLSGELPSSLLSLPDINVLEGNMFACNNGDASQLPVNDPKYESYDCGSDSTNGVLIAWFVLVVSIGTMAVVVLQWLSPPSWSCSAVYEAVCSTRYFTTAPIVFTLLAREESDESFATSRPSLPPQQMSPLHEPQQPPAVHPEESVDSSPSTTVATRHITPELPPLSSLLPLRALSNTSCLPSEGYQTSRSIDFFRIPDLSFTTTSTAATLPAKLESLVPTKNKASNHLHMLLWENQYLRLLIGLICLYACVVLMPVYSVLKINYGTYTFQYAWDVAFAFMKGTTPLAVLMMFFFALLTAMFVLAYQHKQSHDHLQRAQWTTTAGEQDEELRSSSISSLTISTVARLSSMVSMSSLRQIRQGCDRGLLWLVIIFVGNCGLVFVVNGAYVYAISQNYNRVTVEFISFLISVFKLVWGNLVVLRVIDSWTQDLLSPTHQSLFLVVLSMFNNILAPYAAEAFVSPNCFEYSLIPPSPDTSEISTEPCYISSPTLNPENSTIICGASVTRFVNFVSALSNPVTTVTFYPPFIYSYQCSSTLVSVFGGVFVVRYLLSGVVAPLVHGTLKAAQLFCLHRYGIGAWSFRTITTCLPILYRPVAFIASSMNTTAFQLINDDILLGIPRPLTLRKVYAVRIISDLAVLLTFGVLFPPLALVIGFSMIVEMVTLEYGLGRIAELAVSDPRPQAQIRKLLVMLNESFDGFGKGIWTFFPTLTVFCAVLWSFSFFDIASNEAGGVETIWIIPIVSCLPLSLQCCMMLSDYCYGKGYCRGCRTAPSVNSTPTVSNVELPIRKTEDPPAV